MVEIAGQPWSVWLSAENSHSESQLCSINANDADDLLETQKNPLAYAHQKSINGLLSTTALPLYDQRCFRFCPQRDDVLFVVCEHCKLPVKAEALKLHLDVRHRAAIGSPVHSPGQHCFAPSTSAQCTSDSACQPVEHTNAKIIDEASCPDSTAPPPSETGHDLNIFDQLGPTKPIARTPEPAKKKGRLKIGHESSETPPPRKAAKTDYIPAEECTERSSSKSLKLVTVPEPGTLRMRFHKSLLQDATRDDVVPVASSSPKTLTSSSRGSPVVVLPKLQKLSRNEGKRFSEIPEKQGVAEGASRSNSLPVFLASRWDRNMRSFPTDSPVTNVSKTDTNSYVSYYNSATALDDSFDELLKQQNAYNERLQQQQQQQIEEHFLPTRKQPTSTILVDSDSTEIKRQVSHAAVMISGNDQAQSQQDLHPNDECWERFAPSDPAAMPRPLFVSTYGAKKVGHSGCTFSYDVAFVRRSMHHGAVESISEPSYSGKSNSPPFAVTGDDIRRMRGTVTPTIVVPEKFGACSTASQQHWQTSERDSMLCIPVSVSPIDYVDTTDSRASVPGFIRVKVPVGAGERQRQPYDPRHTAEPVARSAGEEHSYHTVNLNQSVPVTSKRTSFDVARTVERLRGSWGPPPRRYPPSSVQFHRPPTPHVALRRGGRPNILSRQCGNWQPVLVPNGQTHVISTYPVSNPPSASMHGAGGTSNQPINGYVSQFSSMPVAGQHFPTSVAVHDAKAPASKSVVLNVPQRMTKDDCQWLPHLQPARSFDSRFLGLSRSAVLSKASPRGYYNNGRMVAPENHAEIGRYY